MVCHKSAPGLESSPFQIGDLSMAHAIHQRNLPVAEGAPLPLPIESVNERIGKVYAYTAGALSISIASAVISAKVGLAATVITTMAGAPLMTAIGLVAVGTALVAGATLAPKENRVFKHACYGLFAVVEGVVLSPLVVAKASAFAAASVATVAVTGGLGALAMTLKESFEKYETILMVGLGAIALASLGSVVLYPAASALAHQISYVGGFALFGAFVIYDTHKARREAEQIDFDPIKHSMNIYLDAMNLLVRLWETFKGKQ